MKLWHRIERRELTRALHTAQTLDLQVERTVADLEAAFAEFRNQIDRLRVHNDARDSESSGGTS